MVANLARLFYLTGEAAYRDRAEATVKAFAGDARQRGFGMPTLLNANETLQAGLQVVVVGAPDDEKTAALVRAVYGQSLPDRVLQTVVDTDALPAGHPAKGKRAERGRAVAFVCRAQTCSLPIADPAGLGAALAYA